MDDVTKQNVMVSAIAFNITVVAYQLVFNSDPFQWSKLLIGILAGALLGGVVFGGMHFLSR
jgi:hypothetical protein